MKQPTAWVAALYLRLSKEDNDKEDESKSISNQRAIAEQWCHRNGVSIYDSYVDDDYSGTNFNRPSFQRMIADIEGKKVNCVVTKDLSRLGRNYIESGMYTEVYFPEKGVRYVAVDDNVDSTNESSMAIAPFKNLLNEMYAKDISEKIRSAKKIRAEQGKYIGSFAPYGYYKDPQDHNHLLIDEETAPIVRRIYKMCIEGSGITIIAKTLTSEGIPSPSGKEQWYTKTILDILNNPVYTGKIVVCRRSTVSLKCKKHKSNGWQGEGIVDGSHEAIVSQQKQELALKVMKSRRRGGDEHKVHNNIFKGLLKCPDCGKSLTLANERGKMNFRCLTYRKSGKEACTSHKISEEELYSTVTKDIRRIAENAATDNFAQRLTSKLNGTQKSRYKSNARELSEVKNKLAKIDNLFAKLYEDRYSEEISERNYKNLMAKYEQEQAELDARLSELEESGAKAKENSKNAEDFTELIKRYSDVAELDVKTVNELIDKIVVHERDKESKVQEVDIYYKFVGKVE